MKVLLANERSELHFLVPNTPMELHRSDWKYVSVFPLEGQLTGLAIRGAFYPLENAKLTADYPWASAMNLSPRPPTCNAAAAPALWC